MSSSTNLLDISVWKKNRINTFWREGASGVSRLMRTGVDSKFVVGVLFPDFKRALEFSRLWESVTVPLKCKVNVTDYFSSGQLRTHCSHYDCSGLSRQLTYRLQFSKVNGTSERWQCNDNTCNRKYNRNAQ